LSFDLLDPAEKHHSMPFGSFLLFSARPVLPGIRRGDRDVGDRPALRVVTCLGIAPEVAYENHFVYRSHLAFPSINFLAVFASNESGYTVNRTTPRSGAITPS